MPPQDSPEQLARKAASLNVSDLFEVQAALHGQAVALQVADESWTFAELNARVHRLCDLLLALGVKHGDRVAILSENRREYVQALLAAARIGAIVACLNWRQSRSELAHCIALVTPKVALFSPRFAEHQSLFDQAIRTIELGEAFEAALSSCGSAPPPVGAEPEDGLYILYTSGTTGKPKAALISHRALIARGAIGAMNRGFRSSSTFVAWAPMFHMVSTDYVLVTLASGGKVIVVDGFQADALCAAIEREDNLGWLVLMPGMIDAVVAEVERRGIKPRPMDSVGCMADLVPHHQIAQVTRLFNAPFRNTFGSTEAGPAPGGGGTVPVGVVPDDLAKTQSSLILVRLVDTDGRDVAPGQPGECLLKSPSLFSGYWGMPKATAEAFAGGWFHTGDVFLRHPDGKLQFVDRQKYLIKSGGENIYPSEIEQLLLASPRIVDAAVVRKADARWGEVPVVFVARADVALTPEEVMALLRGQIASYKLPREVRFIDAAAIPRSATGKVKRHELEAMLKA